MAPPAGTANRPQSPAKIKDTSSVTNRKQTGKLPPGIPWPHPNGRTLTQAAGNSDLCRARAHRATAAHRPARNFRYDVTQHHVCNSKRDRSRIGVASTLGVSARVRRRRDRSSVRRVAGPPAHSRLGGPGARVLHRCIYPWTNLRSPRRPRYSCRHDSSDRLFPAGGRGGGIGAGNFLSPRASTRVNRNAAAEVACDLWVLLAHRRDRAKSKLTKILFQWAAPLGSGT